MSAPIRLTDLVLRPAVGSLGKNIQVRTNFFDVTIPNINIHHYDVTITPDVPAPVNRKVFKHFITLHRVSDLGNANPVYDGKFNLYSAKALPFEARTFDIILPSDIATQTSKKPVPGFKIKVKWAAKINLEELRLFLQGRAAMSNNILTAITALDILIHHQPAMLYTTIGRSFYTPTGKQLLSGPLEAWHGYYQSARPVKGKMMINIDVSSTAFYQSGSLIEIICKIMNLHKADDLKRPNAVNWAKVERALKGVRVRVTHRAYARSFRIMKITPKSAAQTTFTLREQGQPEDAPGTTISIASYYQKTYNRSLSFPNLPCADVGRGVLLPLELCSVEEGQRYPRKLDEQQTADMIKFTTQPPHARANNIKDGLQILQYQNNEYLKEFGLKVSKDMMTLNARVLPPPTISYHATSKQASFAPRDGAWNLIGKKVVVGAQLISWGVVVFANERQIPMSQVKGFVRELIVTCADTGMSITNKDPPVVYGDSRGNIEGVLKQAWQRAGDAAKKFPQLLLVILPTTGVPLYAEVKRVTDTVLGVASQCIQSKHTRDPKKQYCANVCLKINIKLGGTNLQLGSNMVPTLTSKPTMIFGADVNHPGKGDTMRPSIASVVGSMDIRFARFASAVRTQSANTEVIQDLQAMVTDLLMAFRDTNKRLPERILFYRDGVSEGEFAKVMQSEVAAIRAALTALTPTARPTITFVVVQKRHHTRFFPMKREESDRSGNCMAGTLIDTGIVHPFEFDFYLQSHAGLLGTSRPAHYYVLCDENKFTADQLQDATYKLCHLFARCTRTVSVVPPAYYAHIVAQRARFHTKDENWSETTSILSTSSEAHTYANVKANLLRGAPGPVLVDLPKDVTAANFNKPIPAAPSIPARPPAFSL
ncbi:hypothetical protein BGZ50_007129 [Haplosporangium sp. Z 11]|nr:hypothetical protein BGZ50_007129 [Haplosporangium sp. Z 11]